MKLQQLFETEYPHLKRMFLRNPTRKQCFAFLSNIEHNEGYLRGTIGNEGALYVFNPFYIYHFDFVEEMAIEEDKTNPLVRSSLLLFPNKLLCQQATFYNDGVENDFEPMPKLTKLCRANKNITRVYSDDVICYGILKSWGGGWRILI
tara:strand:- start:1098 stop:1541 length:444 start_codon:yes stop_codon:yes gene_type:complete